MLHGSVYVGGGYEGKHVKDDQYSNRLDVYNLTTNRWDSSPITTPYCFFAMTALDDKLIIAGGVDKNGKITNEVLVLDGGEWEYYSKMPTSRRCATAVACQSMLLIVGGQNIIKGQWTMLATTELLCTNECWYTCNNLPVAHMQLKAIVAGNVLYVLGGYTAGLNQSPQVFIALLDNLSSHQLKWQSLPDTPWCLSAPVILFKFLLTVGGRRPSDDHSQTTVVGVADNKIIVIGGLTPQRKYSKNMYISVFE